MTEEEITKVTKICLTADSWCECCVGNLIAQLSKAFPEYAGVIDGVYQHSENYRDLYRKRRDEGAFGDPDPNIWEICI
jgi:hypothetical protein